MRISLLIDREPFQDIFSRTMEGFLRERRRQDHSVTWHKPRLYQLSNSEKQTWLCNPYLNAIFVPSVERRSLSPVLNEFSTSIKPWRTPLQKLYVCLATNRLTSQWFSSMGVDFSPPVTNAHRLLIMGGNHHLRILDHAERCCYVIHKAGFETEFMDNEITVRTKYPWLPAPSIKEVATTKTWYSEEVVDGTAINRPKVKSASDKSLAAVWQPLLRLYRETQEVRGIREYGDEIAAQIDLRLKKIQVFSTQLKQMVREQVAALLEIILSQREDVTVTTVQSHGDFQPANILADEQAWLIDWEYTDRRQLYYDSLVYGLSSRFPSGLATRIAQAVASGDNGLNSPCLDEGWKNKTARIRSLALFLLEELLLKVKENSNPLFRRINGGTESFVHEAELSLRVLNDARA